MYSFTSQGATPHTPQGSDPMASSGNTPFGRALNSAQGVPLPPTMPLIPPAATPTPQIKSHSIQHPDGTVVTQTFHAPKEPGMLGQKPTTPKAPEPQKPTMPPIKVIGGVHHVPFQGKDGTIKYINSKGETH